MAGFVLNLLKLIPGAVSSSDAAPFEPPAGEEALFDASGSALLDASGSDLLDAGS